MSILIKGICNTCDRTSNLLEDSYCSEKCKSPAAIKNRLVRDLFRFILFVIYIVMVYYVSRT
jgi:predicted nucleic acid-binding Zn ribbon protein